MIIEGICTSCGQPVGEGADHLKVCPDYPRSPVHDQAWDKQAGQAT